MSDIPMVELILGEAMQPAVVVEARVEVASIPELIREAPELLVPEGAVPLAQSINFLAVGDGFQVIENPSSFRAAYEAQIAKEDPDTPWSEGVVRLIDYGVPDFDQISAPNWTGEALVFFARDTFTGLPYRVQIALGQGDASLSEQDYSALELFDIEEDEAASAEPVEMSAEDRAFLEEMSGAKPAD
ncbi:MAG: hypothetical protein ABJR46_13155 [Tateyamaria sp.]|uniref:hypothetical protein n=1 Tax=Tateyamaria sp. TaxID=1929288 RepID=UPI00329B1413